MGAFLARAYFPPLSEAFKDKSFSSVIVFDDEEEIPGEDEEESFFCFTSNVRYAEAANSVWMYREFDSWVKAFKIPSAIIPLVVQSLAPDPPSYVKTLTELGLVTRIVFSEANEWLSKR